MLLYTIHRTAVDLVVEKTLRCSLTKIIKIYQFCSVCAPPPTPPPPALPAAGAFRRVPLTCALLSLLTNFAFLVVPGASHRFLVWEGQPASERPRNDDTQDPRQSPKRPRGRNCDAHSLPPHPRNEILTCLMKVSITK